MFSCGGCFLRSPGAPGESLRLGWWYPWRLVQVVAPELSSQGKSERNSAHSLCALGRGSHPPGSYRSPYSEVGAGGGREGQGFRIAFLASGRKTRIWGSESFAWEMKAKLEPQAGRPRLLGRRAGMSWCPASYSRCPLGPDLGSAAAGPPVSLPFQSPVDRD